MRWRWQLLRLKGVQKDVQSYVDLSVAWLLCGEPLRAAKPARGAKQAVPLVEMPRRIRSLHLDEGVAPRPERVSTEILARGSKEVEARVSTTGSAPASELVGSCGRLAAADWAMRAAGCSRGVAVRA